MREGMHVCLLVCIHGCTYCLCVFPASIFVGISFACVYGWNDKSKYAGMYSDQLAERGSIGMPYPGGLV